MKKTLLLFPNQLFEKHECVSPNTHKIVLIEDELFFKDHQYPVNFHHKKLIFHRASMQCYFADLKSQGFEVSYRNWQNNGLQIFFEAFIDGVNQQHFSNSLSLYDSVDYALNKRLKRYASEYEIDVSWLQSPLFINSDQVNKDYRANKKRWFMADFYQFQRRRLNILMEEGKPKGGKWSYDEENRKKIPKKLRSEIPAIHFPVESEWVFEAREYVVHKFPNAIGNSEHFEYPISHHAAKSWLEEFLEQRFANFGIYEDALVPNQGWLYHSALTPVLNSGLLDPKYVVERSLEFALEHDIPMNSVEGFIRQIIGWREFMRATYVDLGVPMRNGNHWQHHRNIPKSFYEGSTGIKPIDDVIVRALDSAYCHHIERLMVLGGFMFLCEFEPKQIYQWFMEIFIDAYDWVMVPNVFAMSQHADGGLITTKPYFSGSSYLRKMGYDDFKNVDEEKDWCAIWDGLYWRWIDKNKQDLSKNHRWSMMCSMATKMDKTKMENHKNIANEFLQSL